MEIIMKEIKKRNKMTKYLEDIFINEAIDAFMKNRSILSLNENVIEEKWHKYSIYITRIWLNYLDNDQFKKVLSKKLEKIALSERNIDEKIFI